MRFYDDGVIVEKKLDREISSDQNSPSPDRSLLNNNNNYSAEPMKQNYNIRVFSSSKKRPNIMRRYWRLLTLVALLLFAVLVYLTFRRSLGTSLPRVTPRTFVEETAATGGAGDRVKVQVYMESQCSDTTNFMQTQLVPSYSKVKDFVDLELVPYGKAKEKPVGDDDYSFNCQHGETECSVNQMMCCGMKRLNNSVERYLPYVSCLQGEDESALRGCCENAKLTYDDVEACARNKEGRRLHHEMGILTHKLKPKLYFVPWIVINGKRDKGAMDDFVKSVCNKYKGPTTPSACL